MDMSRAAGILPNREIAIRDIIHRQANDADQPIGARAEGLNLQSWQFCGKMTKAGLPGS